MSAGYSLAGYRFTLHSEIEDFVLGMDPKVVISVAAICVIFFVLSYYRILKRIIFPCHRRAVRQPIHGDNFEDASPQLFSHGLALSIMQTLPITRFEKGANDEEQPKPSSTDCAICLGEFEDGEWLKHLPRCKHVFHITCIDAWFQHHSNCPLCRSLVYDYYHLITCQDESLVSSQTLLRTLRREDFSRERELHYQIVRSDILQNLDARTDVPGAAVVPLQ